MQKLLSTKDLKKHPKNPRFIKTKSFENLCASIQEDKEYFNARPIIVSNRTKDLIIIAGNQRFEAAKKIGMEIVPVYILEGLSEQDELRIMFKDNSDAFGEFDWNIIKNNNWQSLLLSNESWGVSIPEIIVDKKDDSKGNKKRERTILMNYTVFFDSQEDMDQFNLFLNKLRNRFAGTQNVSKRILAWISELYEENGQLKDSELLNKLIKIDNKLNPVEENKKLNYKEVELND